MKSVPAGNLLNRIDLAIQDIQSFAVASPLEKSYLAKFLVVFISGIYEEIIETIINEKVARLNSPQVSAYVDECLNRGFRNPSITNINSLLKNFDASWVAAIINMPTQSKDALDTIVDNKNSLAHGRACNITLIDVFQFYKDSKLIIEKIDEIIL